MVWASLEPIKEYTLKILKMLYGRSQKLLRIYELFLSNRSCTLMAFFPFILFLLFVFFMFLGEMRNTEIFSFFTCFASSSSFRVVYLILLWKRDLLQRELIK